jgi:hypothetical protein
MSYHTVIIALHTRIFMTEVIDQRVIASKWASNYCNFEVRLLDTMFWALLPVLIRFEIEKRKMFVFYMLAAKFNENVGSSIKDHRPC